MRTGYLVLALMLLYFLAVSYFWNAYIAASLILLLGISSFMISHPHPISKLGLGIGIGIFAGWIIALYQHVSSKGYSFNGPEVGFFFATFVVAITLIAFDARSYSRQNYQVKTFNHRLNLPA